MTGIKFFILGYLCALVVTCTNATNGEPRPAHHHAAKHMRAKPSPAPRSKSTIVEHKGKIYELR